MTLSGSSKKVANSLVALSSAAVLAVYSAGYLRTQPAAGRLARQAVERRPAVPSPPIAAEPVADLQPAPSNVPAAAPSQSAPAAPSLTTPPEPSDTAPAQTAEVPAAPAELLPPAPASAAAAPASASQPWAAAAEPKPDAPIPAPPPAPTAPAKTVWKDGTYYGWGSSRHGSIQAAVVVESGRISSATIAQCQTRYSCSVIEKLPPQVAQRQSPEVDLVSGATQSADAFYYAVVDALSKAK